MSWWIQASLVPAEIRARLGLKLGNHRFLGHCSRAVEGHTDDHQYDQPSEAEVAGVVEDWDAADGRERLFASTKWLPQHPAFVRISG